MSQETPIQEQPKDQSEWLSMPILEQSYWLLKLIASTHDKTRLGAIPRDKVDYQTGTMLIEVANYDHHDESVVSAVDKSTRWLLNNGFMHQYPGQAEGILKISAMGFDLIDVVKRDTDKTSDLVDFVTSKEQLEPLEVEAVDVLDIFVRKMESSGRSHEAVVLNIDNKTAVNLSRISNKNITLESLSKATNICKSRGWLKTKYLGSDQHENQYITQEGLIHHASLQNNERAIFKSTNNVEPLDSSDAPAPDAKVKNDDIPRNHYVVIIHGIRTQAEYQSRLESELNKIPGIKAIPLKYEYFDAIRFLTFGRNAPVENIVSKIRDCGNMEPRPEKLSVIAHSFGTYIVSKILKNHEDVVFHRIIFCGSVVPARFPWQKYRASFSAVLNDCGTKDIWPVLAKFATWGYGASGRFGFGHTRVTDRYQHFKHSDYFEKGYSEKYWYPFITDGTIVEGELDRKTTSLGVSLLTVVKAPILLLFALWLFANNPNLLTRQNGILGYIEQSYSDAKQYVSRILNKDSDDEYDDIDLAAIENAQENAGYIEHRSEDIVSLSVTGEVVGIDKPFLTAEFNLFDERYKNNLIESIEHVKRTYMSEISPTEKLVFDVVFYNTSTDSQLAGCDAIRQIIKDTYQFSRGITCQGAKDPSIVSDGVRLEVLKEELNEESIFSSPDNNSQSGVVEPKVIESSNGNDDSPGSVFRDCENTCPEMVVIPKGMFNMGASDSNVNPEIWELPQQSIEIDKFAIGRFEITRRQFLEFAEQNDFQFADQCKAPDETGSWSEMDTRDIYALRVTNGFDQNNFPIACINMFDVEEYIAWLNEKIGTNSYRLPSEAELEYVIKSGSDYLYSWGDDSSNGCKYANGPDKTLKRVHPDRKLVGHMDCEDGFAYFSPSGAKTANEFNVFDTVGNVYEWSADCYESTLQGIPFDGTPRSVDNCSNYTVRGGSWAVSDEEYLRSSFRISVHKVTERIDLGFRVAKDLDIPK